MKYIVLIVFSIGIMIAGCSKLEDNITQPAKLTVHKPGISDPHSLGFHGNIIKYDNWSMESCKQCHSANFTGGGSATACTNCHTAPEGPLSCNTCHGDFNDPSRIAPPRDLSDNTLASASGVGAHNSHLNDNSFGTVTCQNCHNVPASVYAAGHLDTDDPAEIMFDSLAVHGIATNASYSNTDLTCGNTYCHGNFEFNKSDAPAERKYIYTADKITGLNRTVKWTNTSGSDGECGSCHGLPPAGHRDFPLTQCVACHSTVVNENGEIINKSKHINGVINYGSN